jgi:hypothetical protein
MLEIQEVPAVGLSCHPAWVGSFLASKDKLIRGHWIAIRSKADNLDIAEQFLQVSAAGSMV